MVEHRLVREQGLPGRRVGEDYRFLEAAVQDYCRRTSVMRLVIKAGRNPASGLKGDPGEDRKRFTGNDGRPEAEE